jgi:hypothetical protein
VSYLSIHSFDGPAAVRSPSKRDSPVITKPRARPTGLSQSSSTAIIIPFPAARARIGQRDTIRHVAQSPSHGELVEHATTGLDVFDYLALALVLASVAFGPVLAWVLL